MERNYYLKLTEKE